MPAGGIGSTPATVVVGLLGIFLRGWRACLPQLAVLVILLLIVVFVGVFIMPSADKGAASDDVAAGSKDPIPAGTTGALLLTSRTACSNFMHGLTCAHTSARKVLGAGHVCIFEHFIR